MESQVNADAKTERYEEFLQYFARDRERLFSFVYSLLPHRANAEDVFQRCSIALWRKFPEFDRSRSFLAWACKFAQFEVRNFLRTSGRDRLQFAGDLIDRLASERLETLDRQDERVAALQSCLQRLRSDERELIDVAYGREWSVKEFAERTGQALQTLYNRLSQLRQRLLHCVQSSLTAGDGAT